MSGQLSIYREHNQTVLDELEPGDLVDFDRGVYRHYAVYKGDGKVIHLAGDERASGWSHRNSTFSSCGVHSNKAEVKEDDFWNVTKGCKARKNNKYDKKFEARSKEAILKEAEARIGQRLGYNLFTNNCETFVNECRYNRSTSGQGSTLGRVLFGIATIIVVVVGVLIALFTRR